MNKKYTIEVPIYSSPIEHLIELNQLKDIGIVMYGGFPNSPLNGGRYNYNLDGLFIWDRLFYRLTKKQLSKALSSFYKTVTKANENNIPFLFAFTNMFVSDEESNDENLYPVKWLVESSRKHRVKNGLIIYNQLLEGRIRQKYGDELIYISSCTKYVSPHKILTPRETLSMYLEDSVKYDFVTLTPQDSRRENLIKDAVRASKGKFIAICNSYCSDNCNSYYHYEYMSNENKKSLLAVGDINILAGAFAFLVPRALTCSTFHQIFRKVNIEKIARMQLDAGIVNFKLGRGLGANLIDQLVSLIRESQKN
jgi:hypothetical protein